MRVAPVICVLSAVAALSLPARADVIDPSISFHLPYSVNAGDQHLAPGNYTLQQVDGTADVFSVYNNNTGRYETMMTARPVEQTSTAKQTDVTLRDEGGTYVMDKVQIQGRSLAYKFMTPESVAARNKERAETGNSGS